MDICTAAGLIGLFGWREEGIQGNTIIFVPRQDETYSRGMIYGTTYNTRTGEPIPGISEVPAEVFFSYRAVSDAEAERIPRESSLGSILLTLYAQRQEMEWDQLIEATSQPA
ncbi:hypothetical protein HYZ97_03125 [Candidatus Pacearchaeota archaeon]|nr:hypothetical protein [Candidatus Pacearchaeota archaeon]